MYRRHHQHPSNTTLEFKMPPNPDKVTDSPYPSQSRSATEPYSNTVEQSEAPAPHAPSLPIYVNSPAWRDIATLIEEEDRGELVNLIRNLPDRVGQDKRCKDYFIKEDSSKADWITMSTLMQALI
jgi:hypothetical protein